MITNSTKTIIEDGIRQLSEGRKPKLVLYDIFLKGCWFGAYHGYKEVRKGTIKAIKEMEEKK